MSDGWIGIGISPDRSISRSPSGDNSGDNKLIDQAAFSSSVFLRKSNPGISISWSRTDATTSEKMSCDATTSEKVSCGKVTYATTPEKVSCGKLTFATTSTSEKVSSGKPTDATTSDKFHVEN